FVKPQGDRLNLLLRVPLKAIRDVNFPERSTGYLELDQVAPFLKDAATLWISDYLDLRESDTRLPKRPNLADARISLEPDGPFACYEAAVAHFHAPPLANDVNVVWNQPLLDVWFQYPIRSERSDFSIHPALGRLGVRVVTALRFLPPGGAVRAFEFVG